MEDPLIAKLEDWLRLRELPPESYTVLSDYHKARLCAHLEGQPAFDHELRDIYQKLVYPRQAPQPQARTASLRSSHLTNPVDFLTDKELRDFFSFKCL